MKVRRFNGMIVFCTLLVIKEFSEKYDVFISHASEDKPTIADELARSLVSYKLKVWYDEFTLEVGDSLTEKINHGLANSEFGIVIVSKNFFRKNWPKEELNGLSTKSNLTGKRVILPVWHEVTKEDVCRYSPILADKLAINTKEGVDVITAKLVRAIKGTEYLDRILSVHTELEKEGHHTKSFSNRLFTLLQQANISLFNIDRHRNPRISLDFHDAELPNANLEGADLFEVNLRNANLEGVSLKWANLYGATLMDANLSKTNSYHAALKFANLQYAKLESSNFEYTYLDRADLRNADLTNASLKYASIECADIKDAILKGTNLYGTFHLPISKEEAIMRGAVFQL